MSSYIRGQIKRLVYDRESYLVFKMHVYEAEDRQVREATVTGNFFGIPNVLPPMVLEIEGNWTKHRKYGWQFKMSTWRPWSKDTSDITYFLFNCARIFPTWDVTRRVVDAYGTDTYKVLGEEETILELSQNEQDRQDLAQSARKWKNLLGTAALANFLQEYEIGSNVIAAVFQRFGLEAISVLKNNPYRLLEVPGVPFKKADQLGLRRGLKTGDIRRVMGGILWVLADQLRQGHVFVPRGDLPQLLPKLATYEGVPGFASPDYTAALSQLEELESIKVVPKVGIYTPAQYWYEEIAASTLSDMLAPSNLAADADKFLADYEAENEITLSEKQRLAVTELLKHKVLVVTGAPGTGKTTLVRAFVRLFRDLGISHTLMAPTGIAAKRLGYVTGAGAQTIHRALKYDGWNWGVNRDNPLTTQAVIVDETSMVDQELFYRLLEGLDESTMLVLVGDDAQLPSVGAGNVLRELLACTVVPTVRLDHVFRQAETSDIVLAAHKIRKGSSPLGLPEKKTPEFKFLSFDDEHLLANFIVRMAVKLKDRDANFQVLSPKYDGPVGVTNLNTLIRDELNPNVGQPSWSSLGFESRLGDRLMVVKNNYNLNVYNGDLGKLVGIKAETLVVRIHGVGDTPDTDVEIPKDMAPVMLRLAYAVTVHKSQGEEFETVVLPLVRSQGRMLQRNLFYTAITRARKKVWLLGETEAILRAVANDKVVRRNTRLAELIEKFHTEGD